MNVLEVDVENLSEEEARDIIFSAFDSYETAKLLPDQYDTKHVTKFITKCLYDLARTEEDRNALLLKYPEYLL